MGFLKKLKHKTKPAKITPVVHHIAPAPPPKQIIHEVKEQHIDKKIVTAAKETNDVVIQPASKEIVKISEKTNEVVIQPVISDDKKSKKKQTNEIVEETTTIAPYLIAAGGIITIYMIL